jgi:hypothetical protein
MDFGPGCHDAGLELLSFPKQGINATCHLSPHMG